MAPRTAKQRHDYRAASKPNDRDNKSNSPKAYRRENTYERDEPSQTHRGKTKATDVADGEDHAQAWGLYS
jgi:hypothetical protein